MDRQLAEYIQKTGIAIERLGEALDLLNLEDGYEEDKDKLCLFSPGNDLALTMENLMSIAMDARMHIKGAVNLLTIETVEE